jgi:hypothetical protein
MIGNLLPQFQFDILAQIQAEEIFRYIGVQAKSGAHRIFYPVDSRTLPVGVKRPVVKA